MIERRREERLRAPEITFERARTLRRAMTLPEVVLWQAIRGRRIGGLRFRRQHPIGPYILDFFCLAVEIDGACHDHPDRVFHDAGRDAWLQRRQISVLRFMADDILEEDRLIETLDTIHARAFSAASVQ